MFSNCKGKVLNPETQIDLLFCQREPLASHSLRRKLPMKNLLKLSIAFKKSAQDELAMLRRLKRPNAFCDIDGAPNFDRSSLSRLNQINGHQAAASELTPDCFAGAGRLAASSSRSYTERFGFRIPALHREKVEYATPASLHKVRTDHPFALATASIWSGESVVIPRPYLH